VLFIAYTSDNDDCIESPTSVSSSGIRAGRESSMRNGGVSKVK
jgi:hypothetical protein